MKPKHMLLPAFLLLAAPWLIQAGPGQEPPGTLAEAQKLQKEGNFKEAAAIFMALAGRPETPAADAARSLLEGGDCLRRLNRNAELDALREAAVAAHGARWEVLFAAAKSLAQGPHHGAMVGGEFQRGPHRGRARMVNAYERDRVRALQLLQTAMPLLKGDFDRGQAGGLYLHLAEWLLRGSSYQAAWRLQYLTPLDQLPDYEEGYYNQREAQGAPVDEKGDPVYHRLPASWAAAGTDGERWRFALVQAMEIDPGRKTPVLTHFADFLQSQFGVQTLADQPRLLEGGEDDGRLPALLALHTLTDDETVARLATGLKRFKLPAEFNHLRIYREIGDHNRLAQVLENRRQFPRAAAEWEQAGNQERVKQIRGNWGLFEAAPSQPAGQGAELGFRFRNARQVSLEAREIRVAELLADVKSYLKGNPGQLDWEKVQIENLGHDLVERDRKKYVGERVAAWELGLAPRENHFDRVVPIATPLQRPGAYLLTAQVKDGNTSHVVVWVADTVVVRKALPDQTLYFVADAATGKPVAKANLNLFGYKQERIREERRAVRYEVKTRDLAEFTDPDGLVLLGPQQAEPGYNWVAIATTPEGRLAYLGFSGHWYSRRPATHYDRTRTFVITDRPVYRPEQTVKFKFWLNRARYDAEGKSPFAGQEFAVQIRDPLGNQVLEQTFTADEWGGFAGELALKKDARLGVYRIQLPKSPGGGGTFRVEEYKKPEFEVKVEAPAEPVMLGERIEAKATARYYFGAPVTKGTLKYRVLREEHEGAWYPPTRWDWLFGPGYWWFGYDYSWYPGWKRWGCPRPFPWWWSRPSAPPEVVAEAELPVGPEGSVAIPIDTALAKAIHGDTDHRYTITAEVRDESRRTIVGTGTVLVAREPFKVHVWLDRGHYRAGDAVVASFAARRADGKGVAGKGKARLFKVAYDSEGRPAETPLEEWELATGEDGRARLQLRAAARGQYRLSLALADAAGHSREGACLFCVAGEGFDGADFRFHALELVPDRADYKPGDKVSLLVSTDRIGATVLLFPRAEQGVCERPKVLRLKGRSAMESLEVAKGDMPNFFVEALTVGGGRVFTEIRQIAVPPESRVLDVKVLPSAAKYLPGEKAEIKLLLADSSGEPYSGSAVVTLYDKSVEYIAGGPNVPEIKAFFWQWRRNHHPRTEHSLDRSGRNVAVGPTLVPLGFLGAWGMEFDEVLEGQAGVRFGGLGGRAGAPSARAAKAKGEDGGGELRRRGAAAPGFLGDLREELESKDAAKEGGGGPGPEAAPAAVRTRFADTALWVAALQTGPDGTARVELAMPENLTTWKAKVWAMGGGARVGEGEAEVVTTKNLLLRLQAPRFLVQKDEVVLSANVHSYLPEAAEVRALLELEGGCLELLPGVADARTLRLAAGGEERVDWRLRVLSPGKAVIRMKALSAAESDATQLELPVAIHGMLKTDSFCGVIRPEGAAAAVELRVPAERLPDQSRLEVRWSPSLATAMVDAVPYLAAYPYGCTEQTLNRFLPTVLTQKVLQRLGVDLAAIREKRVNLNPQEIGDDKERAEQWRRWRDNPVFDAAEVAAMVKAGLEALGAMQCADGGWGWFSGWNERSWPHTTAVVVRGLQLARENDVALVPGVLERGVKWLATFQAGELQKLRNGLKEPRVRPWKERPDNLDALVFLVLAGEGQDDGEMRGRLYDDRNHLSAYGKALLGLALHRQGHAAERDMLLRNLEQFLREDDENQSAWLDLGAGNCWWYWHGSEIETHAAFLKLLAAAKPKERTASRLVKYLLNNRKHATWWNSTRDTAFCLEAFADYLKATGEDKPDLSVEIRLDGNTLKTVRITPESLFSFDNRLVLSGAAVTAGAHRLELAKTGRGPLYFNAYLTNFTLEDPIAAAGLEIKVERRLYRLVPETRTVKDAGARGQAVDRKVQKYAREPLPPGAVLKSGELVEVELLLESKNDYEYIQIEDMKAAGLEPVEVRSGYTGNEMGAYVEFRDDRVAFFVRWLARGRHSVSYRLRAETPGLFSALPARASGMYAPELKANSGEDKVRVEDR